MFQRYRLIIVLIFALVLSVYGQAQENIRIKFVKNDAEVLPGKVVNLAFRINNFSAENLDVLPIIALPETWTQVIPFSKIRLAPAQTHLGLVAVKSGAEEPVGYYPVIIRLVDANTGKELARDSIKVSVKEIEEVNIQLVDRPLHVLAGEEIQATYLVQNKGNTEKEIYVNASNCDVKGESTLKLQPGESSMILISKPTSPQSFESRNESYTVRIQSGGRVLESAYTTTLVLPSQKAKKDVYYRFPVKASATYLTTNRNDSFESAFQFQIEGNGTLDPEGNHRLGFLARFPNNTDLSFMGLYDQYYVNYANKNMDLFLGDKSFMVTPLTENSRYGRGAEASFFLNNGLKFGITYLKPRFLEEIEHEAAVSLGVDFNKNNKVALVYLSKKYNISPDPAQLFSINTEFKPFEQTQVELEYSRAKFNNETSDAFRAGLNSQFSIFQVSGIYYDAGKNYPGYYTNSRFYSANVNTRITEKMSFSFNVREDFNNAHLDTFFVIAPYSKSLQGAVSYRIARESTLKLYYRQYERKDRLNLEKFHYRTNSWDLQLSQRYKRIYYNLIGEIGETTNLLLIENNVQNSYRATADLSYRFNSKHSVRLFGTWSNINQFVSNDQRNITAGISATSRITKNLRLNFYLQNAYDIDDYYRNRNLLQFNLDYNFLKKHSLTLHSFYTIFKTVEENPELTMALTYAYNLGIPVKQTLVAGKIEGRITDQSGNPVEGVFIRVLNETTVSDKNGDFEFKLVSPGRQMLMIDREKLKLDEITNIPMPLELDIVGNETSNINIQIVKGCQLRGQLRLENSSLSVLNNDGVPPENVVLELSSEFENYRITTDKEGKFIFPLTRPGNLTLRVYPGTIPTGYSIRQSSYSYTLQPGEHRDVEIVLESKKKNIIFKPIGNLSVLNQNVKSLSSSAPLKVSAEPETYFTILIGESEHLLPANQGILKDEPFYFEKQIDNLHKYFIGKFRTLEEAEKELERIKQKNKSAELVIWKDNKIRRVEEFNNNRNEHE